MSRTAVVLPSAQRTSISKCTIKFGFVHIMFFCECQCRMFKLLLSKNTDLFMKYKIKIEKISLMHWWTSALKLFALYYPELNLESTNFPGVKLRPKVSVRSYGSREGSVSSRSGECSPVPMGSFPRRGFMNGSRESTGYLEELEKER